MNRSNKINMLFETDFMTMLLLGLQIWSAQPLSKRHDGTVLGYIRVKIDIYNMHLLTDIYL